MAQVFAGFVVGFALSLIVAPAGAYALISSNERTGLAQRVAPPGTNFIALSMVLQFGAALTFTAFGMLLGIMLAGLDDRSPSGGLGSPNAAYTIIVVATAAVIVIPMLIVPAIRKYAIVAALIFAVSFGWCMPWLASLG